MFSKVRRVRRYHGRSVRVPSLEDHGTLENTFYSDHMCSIENTCYRTYHGRSVILPKLEDHSALGIALQQLVQYLPVVGLGFRVQGSSDMALG